MNTCTPLHILRRSLHSCPRRVSAGNKNTPCRHNPRRRNVATSMLGLKNGHIHKNLTQNGEPQRQLEIQKKNIHTSSVVLWLGVCLESGRPGDQFLVFLIKFCQWLEYLYSSDCPAGHHTVWGLCWNWLAQCQYTVTG